MVFNKESCRSCGKILVPISMCSYCKEHVSWICNKCQRVEDVSHKHYRTSESLQDTDLNFSGPIESGIIDSISNYK
jgi:predicted amidophosphoribosyltransferase